MFFKEQTENEETNTHSMLQFPGWSRGAVERPEVATHRRVSDETAASLATRPPSLSSDSCHAVALSRSHTTYTTDCSCGR